MRVLGMWIMTRRAAVALGIRMLRGDGCMAGGAGMGRVFPDVMGIVARRTLAVFVLAAPGHGVHVGVTGAAGSRWCIGGGMSVMTGLTRMPLVENSP